MCVCDDHMLNMQKCVCVCVCVCVWTYCSLTAGCNKMKRNSFWFMSLYFLINHHFKGLILTFYGQ